MKIFPNISLVNTSELREFQIKKYPKISCGTGVPPVTEQGLALTVRWFFCSGAIATPLCIYRSFITLAREFL
ncbi:MAG: hypothetical protein SAK29_28410 [Scytonema sp. PMC 1069.18]|nr:hypothetical protein [Scytonema sp. PMC 1069.18]MEC4887676.1 hypothetical protein [Scytonema sp. PMC 1070.18]